MSVALFNSRSSFVFKVWLFRCNFNETSISSISFIFLFYWLSSKIENMQSKCILSHQVWIIPPPIRTRTLFSCLPLPLLAYILYGPLITYFILKSFSNKHYFVCCWDQFVNPSQHFAWFMLSTILDFLMTFKSQV